MEAGSLLIFWYGMLHAMGPDHLTAIADFSIGKSMKKSISITLLFAFGHGMMLFLFAKILKENALPEALTGYGDMISSVVIIGMGLYLFYMALRNRIQLKKHCHEEKEHLHIYFGKEHSHKSSSTWASAWTVGALMGMGGVRGMLVTLGILEGNSVGWSMVLVFVAGVSLVFVCFGVIILYFNRQLLRSEKNLRMAFGAAGLISIAAGGQILFA